MTPTLEAMIGLRGRTALVTGGSRGLGAAVADGLAAAGADVVAIGRSASATVTRAAYRACDMRDEAAFAALCDDLAGGPAPFDIYVHAAGVSAGEPDQSPATFRATVEANLSAPYACARAAAARMPAAGGAIVFVTSIGSRQAFPANPAYVASKGGLAALMRAMALDLGSRGIRVNAVAPGYFRSAMTEASFIDPERHDARRARTMLGRWGMPEDMVGAVVYLVSASAAYVTGHELVVDGGWTAKGL
jgi:NAD(P)-dependent dehydrogenase (short-subunit alcohol dehydrogenase family)